jgi:hypothetical protein
METPMERWPKTERGAEVTSHIVDDKTFRLLLDLETRKAQRLRYPVGVVCLAMDESNATREMLAEMAAWAIRETDSVAWRDSYSVVVLLIDAEAGNLPVIVERLTSALDSAWSAGGACYPESGPTAEKLMDQATAMQTRARQDGGRRLYVASHLS